jgi:hypothetical protein
MKYKQAWKAVGVKGECFNPLPVLKPAVLEPWDRVKMSMPERSYEKFALCNNISFINIKAFYFRKRQKAL